MPKTYDRPEFMGYPCKVVLNTYAAVPQTAITLIDANDLEPVATATCCLPELGDLISKGQVVVKDYSENIGMLEALVKAKIVSEPIEHIRTGYVTVPLCKLLISPADIEPLDEVGGAA